MNSLRSTMQQFFPYFNRIWRKGAQRVDTVDSPKNETESDDTTRTSVHGMDRRVNPGISLYLPTDVDQQKGI